jgi:hypothetical protein
VRADLEGNLPPPSTTNVLPPALAEVRVPAGDLSQYSQLFNRNR